MPLSYWFALLDVLVERFEAAHPEQACWRGFRLLAMNGTTIHLENWQRLRDHYGRSGNGHGKQKTQARMVMLQFPLVRLPCAYEVAPVAQGETTLALRLLPHVRGNDLVLIDPGFWSYGSLARIHARGAYFGVRLKKGISLRRLRSLGLKDHLVSWKPKRVRQNGADLPASMQLRLIRYRLPVLFLPLEKSKNRSRWF
ncbi:MAG: transposase [Planctomycetes bacterium]|nr:transposase [Planctomycetota bacterium]